MWLSFKHAVLRPVLEDHRADTVCISAFVSVSSVCLPWVKAVLKVLGFFIIFHVLVLYYRHTSCIISFSVSHYKIHVFFICTVSLAQQCLCEVHKDFHRAWVTKMSAGCTFDSLLCNIPNWLRQHWSIFSSSSLRAIEVLVITVVLPNVAAEISCKLSVCWSSVFSAVSVLHRIGAALVQWLQAFKYLRMCSALRTLSTPCNAVCVKSNKETYLQGEVTVTSPDSW